MRYGVILADPPWQYDRSGVEGSAAREYTTMTNEAICALPVAELAASDAVLLLWATWPKLTEAIEVVRAWGFTYLTGMPWVKVTQEPRRTLWGDFDMHPQYGVGYWLRGCSEPILVARRGIVHPPTGGYVGLVSENFGHSRKPDNLYQYAEQLPGPYLELFGRRPRAGWDSFGHGIDGRDIRDVLGAAS